MSEVVKVSVVADTSQAKQQLQDLQAQLSQISTQPINVNDASLVAANKAAIELQQNLQKAMNPNTGKLDLSRFSNELQRSGKKLSDYATILQNIGPQGQQAFLSLSNAIATAEAPTTRLNAQLLKFGQTIKNTINWQISSSLIHGIVGQYQAAINYAEKLNTSLNNIRIVTGQNTDQMAAFAKTANESAKRLNTTTTAYTNASLIYYQQGLGDKEVAARTETTLKLANVSRQSVEEVSNQLTAIWNNYAEGSSNLEHYADVITALGAATASSSSEIATGLEKFASIGKTVGLSYDYATTALATITATTRQSADTVGTGLRTLFSRLQGLSLGKTLEDGVNLNKYSAALAKVGVNIQDQYGQVKEMDQILDELGAKWGTISNEQQIALAQTVGGVRQYTNLIALMDNWDYFQQNLKVAQGADGTLEQQAEIYGESWEAASKRVRAAAEGIYSSLLDDKAIIKVIDGFAKFLDIIQGVVEGLGGMKGILLTVASIMTQNLGKQLPMFAKDARQALGVAWNFLRGKPNDDINRIQNDSDALLAMRRGQTSDIVEQAQIDKIRTQGIMNASLLRNQNRMSKEDIESYRTLMGLAGIQDDARIAAAQAKAKEQQGVQDYIFNTAKRYQPPVMPSTPPLTREEKARINTGENIQTKLNNYQTAKTQLENITKQGSQIDPNSDAAKAALKAFEGAKQALLDAMAKAGQIPEDGFNDLAEAAKAAADALREIKSDENSQASEGGSASQSTPQQKAEQTAQQLYEEGLKNLSPEEQQRLGKTVIGYDPDKQLTSTQNMIMKQQQAVMAAPLIQRANQIGQLYGGAGAFNNLISNISDAGKNGSSFSQMSQSAQKEMRANWKASAQNWAETLKTAGFNQGEGGAERGQLLEELLGINFDESDITNIVEKLKGVQQKIQQALVGDVGEEGASPIEGSFLSGLESELEQRTQQYADATGRSVSDVRENITEPTMEAANVNARTNNNRPIVNTPLAEPTQSLLTTMANMGSAAMSLSATLTGVTSAMEVLTDSSASVTSKIGSIVGALGNIGFQASSTANLLTSLGASSSGAGIAGLVISVLTTGIGVALGLYQQQMQRTIETFNQQIEKGTEAISISQNADALISAQQDLINAYKKETLSQQELSSIRNSLIEKVNSSNDRTYTSTMMPAILSGDSTLISEAQRDYQKNIYSQVSSDLETSIGIFGQKIKYESLSGDNFINNFLKEIQATPEIFSFLTSGGGALPGLLNLFSLFSTGGGGLSVGSGNNYRFGSAAANTLMITQSEKELFNLLPNLTEGTVFHFNQDTQSLEFSNTVFDNAENFYEWYSQLLNLYDTITRLGYGDNTTIGKNMKSSINQWADEWEDFQNQYLELRYNSIKRDIVSDEKINDEITDLLSFQGQRQQLIDKYTNNIDKDSEDYQNIVSVIDNTLSTLSNAVDKNGVSYTNINSGLLGLVERQKKLNPNLDEEQMLSNVTTLYEKYGNLIFSLGKSFMIPVEMDLNDTGFREKVEAALNSAQAIANQNTIVAALEAANPKDFKLNQDSSYSEWQSWIDIVNTPLIKDDLDNTVGLWEDFFGTEATIYDLVMSSTEDNINKLYDFYRHLQDLIKEDGGESILKGLSDQRTKLETEIGEKEEELEKKYGLKPSSLPVITKELQPEGSFQSITEGLLQPLYPDQSTLQEIYSHFESYQNFYKLFDELNFDKLDWAAENDVLEGYLNSIMANPELMTALRGLGIDLSGGNKQEGIDALKNLVNNRPVFEQVAADVAPLDAMREDLVGLGSQYEALEKYLAEQEALGSSRDIALEALQSDIDVEQVREYSKALQNQGSFGMSETDYVEQQKQLILAQNELNTALAEGTIDEDTYNNQIKETEKALEELEDRYHNNTEAAQEFALTQMRLEKGVETLKANWAGWQKALKETKEGTWANTKEFLALRKTLADILNTDPEKLTNSFMNAAKAADVIAKAADGTEEGVRAFQEFAGAWAWMKHLGSSDEELGSLLPEEFQEKFHNSLETMKLDTDSFMEAMDDLMNREPGELIPFDENALVSNLANVEGLVDSSLDNINAIAKAFGFQYDWEPVPGPELETEIINATKGEEIEWGENNSAIYGNLLLNKDSETGQMTGFRLVAHDLGGGGAPKSGGGGGGGKPKHKDHKKPDTSTRYHTIRAKQTNNDQTKQEASRKKERAFGAEKIKQAEKEIELQKEAIDLQRQYVDEITNYLSGDRLNMLQAFTPDKLGFDLGFNLNIDENGVITNYRQLEEKLLEEENKLIDRYNEGGVDDEAYDEAQKKIDEAREYLKIYEETRDLYEEQWAKMAEYLDELADAALELTKIKIDLDISFSDDKIELLDYMLEKIEDNAYKAAEAISLLGDKTDEGFNRLSIYQKGLEEILNNKGFSLEDLANLTDEDLIMADFTEAEIEQIREWRSEILNTNKELLGMREQIVDKILDAFDDLNERVQNSYEAFDHYNTVLENYKDITDLLGLRLNQQQRDLLKQLNAAMLNNAQIQANAARLIYEQALENHEAAKRAYDEAVTEGDTEAMLQWRRVIDETQQTLDEAQEQWLEAWQAALEKAQEIYTTAIENVVKAFEEQVSGAFGALDYLQSAFDRMGQTNDQYLQDFEKLYELNKLNRDIQNSIDDVNNIRDKQTLKKLQEEINQLQEEGVKLSQYDVDALRKKFELEQARQALEDARNAKSQVRLQRDANGNWGYVYTAAEDEVEQAEQEYENKLYEYQKLNDDYINELQSRVLEAQATYKDALAEIYNDTTLTDEQRQARIDELNNWLTAEMDYFEQQLQNAMSNQEGTLELYYKLYNNSQAELARTWEDTTLRLLSGADSVAIYMDNVRDAVTQMLSGAANALKEYNDDVDATDKAAGVSTEELADNAANAIHSIKEESSATREEIAALSQELTDNFVLSLSEAIDWEKQYADQIKAATEANEAFIVSLNEMIARLGVLASSNPGLENARAKYKAAEVAHEAFIQKANDPEAFDEVWENAQKEWQEYLEKILNISPVPDTGTPQVIGMKSGGHTGIWDIASGKTGMYTGSWNGMDTEGNGRLAFLHQKELVLNKDDTANFLTATSILRTIDLQANIFRHGFNDFITPFVPGLTDQNLEQNVHIEAQFPNVTQHTEIEQAFDNLINMASQYANRKI